MHVPERIFAFSTRKKGKERKRKGRKQKTCAEILAYFPDDAIYYPLNEQSRQRSSVEFLLYVLLGCASDKHVLSFVLIVCSTRGGFTVVLIALAEGCINK